MTRRRFVVLAALALLVAAALAVWRYEVRFVVVRPAPALPEGAMVIVAGQGGLPLFADSYEQCGQSERDADDLFCMNTMAMLLTEQDVLLRLPYLLRWLNRDPENWPPPHREVDTNRD